MGFSLLRSDVMKTIYLNGNIVTLEGDHPEAIVEEDGKIIAVGNKDLLYKSNMNIVDLNGNTLLPAFLDAHGHFTSYATNLMYANLRNSKSISDILDKLKEYILNNPSKTIIKAKGYDHNYLYENRHPTRKELDSIDRNKIIIVEHQSGHAGVFNSKALKFLNIDESNHLFERGLLEENSYIDAIKKIPLENVNEYIDAMLKTQNIYASYGITTIQEGYMDDSLFEIYERLIDKKYLKLDVIGYVDYKAYRLLKRFKKHIHKYIHHFKIAGYKMFLDGSPQLKTAWVKEPYTDGTYGVPSLDSLTVYNNLKRSVIEGMQVITHCNGDRAIQLYLEEYQKLNHYKDIRPVIIHAQLLRKDQLKLVKKLKMIPSFFVSHVYYWGDIHEINLGSNRAKHMSPAKSCLEENILFTFHNDSPIIEPNIMETIWCAVNRITKSGKKFDCEKISVLEAIKAVTINVAYQYHEERQKGSIKIGKNADFIIIDKNILEIDPMKIKDIKILKTIKDGKIIYERKKGCKKHP